jgi:hypothetical protein
MISCKGKSGKMEQLLADLFGLLLVLSGSLWGIAVGSWLNSGVGGLLGLIVGALWGFHMAEGCTLFLKTQKGRIYEAYAKGLTTVFAQSERTPLSGSRRPWLSRILGRKPAKPPLPETHDLYSLEEIQRRLKAINSQVWRELRLGVLSSCYAGLYSVHLDEAGERLDWQEVNRRTVAALHRFETAKKEEERRASLNEALDRIGQKLLLVQKAALRKADRLNKEEERAIQKNEAELWRLSRYARLSPL